MRAVNRSSWPVWLGALICFGALMAWHRSPKLSAVDPDFVAGYLLLALMVFLALYRGRKKLSMLPLGKASVWLTLHLVGGVLSLPLFWVHTGSLWPVGMINQTLAALFYLTCLSG